MIAAKLTVLACLCEHGWSPWNRGSVPGPGKSGLPAPCLRLKTLFYALFSTFLTEPTLDFPQLPGAFVPPQCPHVPLPTPDPRLNLNPRWNLLPRPDGVEHSCSLLPLLPTPAPAPVATTEATTFCTSVVAFEANQQEQGAAPTTKRQQQRPKAQVGVILHPLPL